MQQILPLILKVPSTPPAMILNAVSSPLFPAPIAKVAEQTLLSRPFIIRERKLNFKCPKTPLIQVPNLQIEAPLLVRVYEPDITPLAIYSFKRQLLEQGVKIPLGPPPLVLKRQ